MRRAHINVKARFAAVPGDLPAARPLRAPPE
jgi:hypothetical protein